MNKLIRISLSILIVTLVLVAIDINFKIDNLQSLGLPLSLLFITELSALVLIFYIGGMLDSIHTLGNLVIFSGYYIFYSIAGSYLKVDVRILFCSIIFGMAIFLVFCGIIENRIKRENKELGKKIYLFSSFATGVSMLLFFIFFLLIR